MVNYLAEQKKLNIAPHKDLDKIKVSLTSRTPFTLSKAWNVLHTLLDMNGFSIVEVDNVHRIVTTKEAGKQPLPFYSSLSGIEPEQLPDIDQDIRYLYRFKNIKVATVQGILSKMLAPNSIKINKDLGACIITEKSRKIKSAMQVVKSLDTGGLRESIKIVRLRYADSENVARLFTSIIGKKTNQRGLRFLGTAEKKEASFFSSTTKIIPEPIQNSLILLGTEKNLNRIIDFIGKHVDVPITSDQSRLHVKEIKYASAQKLKPILEGIIKPPAGQKKEKSQLVGQFKFFEDVVITAESPVDGPGGILHGSGNRLIVACNKTDWQRLEKFIDKLDKPDPQIAMEVMIVDASTDLTRQLGTQLRNKPGWLGKNMDAETMHLGPDARDDFLSERNLIGFAAGAIPGTYATLGNTEESDVWGVIKAILSSNNANIISQPFLVANNNKEAFIDITSNIRVDGKINDPSKVGGARTRDREDMKAQTLVKLTPRINAQGVVNLAITITISEFQETLSGGQPRTSNRELITQASMGTGEVLILGGITTSRLSEILHKTPLLGDLPLIGNLFRSKTKNSTKNNLYIFIRPSVIKPIFEGKPDDYTELKLAYAKYQILGADTYLSNRDPIQRWFFRPRRTSIKQRLADLREGKFRAIDNYTQGKKFPKSVDIKRDPFYKTAEELAKVDKPKTRFSPNLTKLKRRNRKG